MARTILGIHHVTAICGDPQENVDFYVHRLRQRLVKRTVNFDDPGTYHLYYGDRDGSPGTILTFFPFANAGPGRPGTGEASAFAYAVPDLDPWTNAFAADGFAFDGPVERFGERVILFHDPHGQRVELIETGADGSGAIGDSGFHSVTLCERDLDPTARIVRDLFGYEEVGEAQEGGATRLRFRSPHAGRGAVIDLMRPADTAPARQGKGSIHHVAFRAETPEIHREWQDRVASAGLQVTPVIDRQYFDAIYFREPGGVLFEIATDPPGFAVDEPAETMGERLMLPAQYEANRAEIERILPPLNV